MRPASNSKSTTEVMAKEEALLTCQSHVMEIRLQKEYQSLETREKWWTRELDCLAMKG